MLKIKRYLLITLLMLVGIVFLSSNTNISIANIIGADKLPGRSHSKRKGKKKPIAIEFWGYSHYLPPKVKRKKEEFITPPKPPPPKAKPKPVGDIKKLKKEEEYHEYLIFKVGAKVGFSYTILSGGDTGRGVFTPANFGGRLEMNFTQYKMDTIFGENTPFLFAMELDLLYSQKRFNTDYGTIRADFIAFPLHLKFKFPTNEKKTIRPYILFGPNFVYRISSEFKVSKDFQDLPVSQGGSGRILEAGSTYEFKQLYKEFKTSLEAGCGIEFDLGRNAGDITFDIIFNFVLGDETTQSLTAERLGITEPVKADNIIFYFGYKIAAF